MTPQYSSIKSFDLLCVLKDFQETYTGTVDSGGASDLDLIFSVVGENPDIYSQPKPYYNDTATVIKEGEKIRDKKEYKDFVKKKEEEEKKKKALEEEAKREKMIKELESLKFPTKGESSNSNDPKSSVPENVIPEEPAKDANSMTKVQVLEEPGTKSDVTVLSSYGSLEHRADSNGKQYMIDTSTGKKYASYDDYIYGVYLS